MMDVTGEQRNDAIHETRKHRLLRPVICACGYCAPNWMPWLTWSIAWLTRLIAVTRWPPLSGMASCSSLTALLRSSLALNMCVWTAYAVPAPRKLKLTAVRTPATTSCGLEICITRSFQETKKQAGFRTVATRNEVIRGLENIFSKPPAAVCDERETPLRSTGFTRDRESRAGG